MKRLLPLLLVLATVSSAVAQAPAPAPTSALDGQWSGRSNGGSCNAPLDYALTIQDGFVDGTSYDTTAKGPVPNPKKTAPPLPTPGLWQIHGVAGNKGTFALIAVASVRGTDRREGKLSVKSEGGSLIVTESGGCGRTARLAKG